MPKSDSPRAGLEKKVIDYAEDLGRLIGTVRARVDDWKGERDKLAQQLSAVVKEAQSLLADLGQTASRQTRKLVAGGVTRVQETASELASQAKRPGRPRKRRMSAEARARISAAQRKRWAKLRKSEGK
jgi:hypothetical protein